jgi:hypothetical protein
MRKTPEINQRTGKENQRMNPKGWNGQNAIVLKA